MKLAKASKIDHQRKMRGQGLVEFIFVIFIFLNLLLVTFNAVLAFSVQQYISYATFMAARAYQASTVCADGCAASQKAAAEATLVSYLFFSTETANARVLKFQNFPKVLARNIRMIVVEGDPPRMGVREATANHQVQVSFEVPIFQLPMGELGKNLAWITMRSSSYLGREPTQRECQEFFNHFYSYYDRGAPAGEWRGMYDNNC